MIPTGKGPVGAMSANRTGAGLGENTGALGSLNFCVFVMNFGRDGAGFFFSVCPPVEEDDIILSLGYIPFRSSVSFPFMYILAIEAHSKAGAFFCAGAAAALLRSGRIKDCGGIHADGSAAAVLVTLFQLYQEARRHFSAVDPGVLFERLIGSFGQRNLEWDFAAHKMRHPFQDNQISWRHVISSAFKLQDDTKLHDPEQLSVEFTLGLYDQKRRAPVVFSSRPKSTTVAPLLSAESLSFDSLLSAALVPTSLPGCVSPLTAGLRQVELTTSLSCTTAIPFMAVPETYEQVIQIRAVNEAPQPMIPNSQVRTICWHIASRIPALDPLVEKLTTSETRLNAEFTNTYIQAFRFGYALAWRTETPHLQFSDFPSNVRDIYNIVPTLFPDDAMDFKQAEEDADSPRQTSETTRLLAPDL